MCLLDLFQAADRAADQHADLVAVRLGDLQTRFRQCFLGGNHRELHESRHAARLLAVEAGFWLEVDDFAGHLARGGGRIERLDTANARAAGLDRLPGLAGRMAEGGDGAGAGHDHAGPVQHSASPPPPQRRQAAAQVGPLPHASTSAVIPFCNRPSLMASCRTVRGAAASRFPYRAGSSSSREGAMPARLLQACMISGADWSPITSSLSDRDRLALCRHSAVPSNRPCRRVRSLAVPFPSGRAAPPAMVDNTPPSPPARVSTAAAAARL